MNPEELEGINDELFKELALGEQQSAAGEYTTLWTIHVTHNFFTMTRTRTSPTTS